MSNGSCHWRSRHEWGHFAWSYLHTTTLVDGNPADIKGVLESVLPLVERFGDFLPCASCKEHYNELLVHEPLAPCALRPLGLFEWSVRAHNSVNGRLGRPEWTVEQALHHWGTFQDKNRSVHLTAINVQRAEEFKDRLREVMRDECGPLDIDITVSRH